MPLQAVAYMLVSGTVPSWLPLPNVWTALEVVLGVGALTLIKLYSSGATNGAERDLHGRVVLLTGGTSGIGAEVALELAKRGAQLVLLVKPPDARFFAAAGGGGDEAEAEGKGRAGSKGKGKGPAKDGAKGKAAGKPPPDSGPSIGPWHAEYVADLRRQSGNDLIYAEPVDLSSLHSVRRFATRWIDNAPPRRLDMMILCAAAGPAAPRRPGAGAIPGLGGAPGAEGGVERAWMVNYLANFHLLGIMSPALRAQPFDREIRIVMATCPAYMASPSLKGIEADDFGPDGWPAVVGAGGPGGKAKGGKKAPARAAAPTTPTVPAAGSRWTPARAYARSKLALMTFGLAYQKHLDAYKRPDGLPMRARVVFVDPGWTRTPGMREYLTGGSLWGLLGYVCAYFVAWLLLKSPAQGAQSFLHAAMDEEIVRGEGGKLVKECMAVDLARRDVADEEAAKKLWEESDKLIESVEKEQAVLRAHVKAAREAVAKEAAKGQKS